jgi:hypothetical protein
VAKRQRRPKKGSAAQQRRRLAELEGGLSLALAQVTEDSRHAAMTALEAVLSFIDSIPEWERRDFEAPLWTLLCALDDLDYGRVHPMLSPNPAVHNRKPDSNVRKVAKGHAVICVDVLRRSGLSVTEACRFVAQTLQHHDFRLGGELGSPPWKIVNGWRNRLTKLPINDRMRQVVNDLRAETLRLRPLSPEEAKEFTAGQMHAVMQKMGKSALE